MRSSLLAIMNNDGGISAKCVGTFHANLIRASLTATVQCKSSCKFEHKPVSMHHCSQVSINAHYQRAKLHMASFQFSMEEKFPKNTELRQIHAIQWLCAFFSVCIGTRHFFTSVRLTKVCNPLSPQVLFINCLRSN